MVPLQLELGQNFALYEARIYQGASERYVKFAHSISCIYNIIQKITRHTRKNASYPGKAPGKHLENHFSESVDTMGNHWGGLQPESNMSF